MHTSRRSLLLALAAGCLALAPATADAQIGGFIRKKVEQKVADKVRDQANRPKPPAFDDQILEITTERLGQLVRGLDAEKEAARKAAALRQQGSSAQATFDAEMKAYRVKDHEYQVAMSRWSHCTQAAMLPAMQSAGQNPGVQEMMRKMAALPEADREAFQKRMEARQEKMEAADKRGDGPEKKRLFDEMDADMQKTIGMSFFDMQGAGAATGQAMAAGQAKAVECGPQPVPPLQPEPPANSDVVDVRDTVRTAATRASGLTITQYSLMRERVAAWLNRDRSSNSQYAYSDDELKALEQQEAALQSRKGIILGTDESLGGWQW